MQRKRGKTKESGRPTPAQIDLARIVSDRHEVVLPFGYELDGPWIRRFLDCFAFDPETEEDVFRRVRNITAYAREGRTTADMARKLDLRPDQVDFIVETLRGSGYDLNEVIEAFDEDPEEVSWRDLESELERQVYAYT